MNKEKILIKPHHLIDIIKLYGSGIEKFVPNEDFQHDFYRVANMVVSDLDCIFEFTAGGDDICQPCNRYDGQRCTDKLTCIAGYNEKEIYNYLLDTRIIQIIKLDLEKAYSLKQILKLFSEENRLVFLVWAEEDEEITARRNELFQRGCEILSSRL